MCSKGALINLKLRCDVVRSERGQGQGTRLPYHVTPACSKIDYIVPLLGPGACPSTTTSSLSVLGKTVARVPRLLTQLGWLGPKNVLRNLGWMRPPRGGGSAPLRARSGKECFRVQGKGIKHNQRAEFNVKVLLSGAPPFCALAYV